MKTSNRRHKPVSHNWLQDSHEPLEGLQFIGPSFYVGPKTLAAVVTIVCTAFLVFLK